MDHFYFQTLLNTALDGIRNGGLTHSMKFVGNGILVVTALYQIYDAWWRDGDYQELGTVLVKAMVMTTLLNNYDTVFRLVVDAFNGLADTVYTHTTNPNDMINQWLKDVQSHWNANSLKNIWDTVQGGVAAAINIILLVVSYLLLPLAYIVFSFAYLIVGVLLYALGQLVMALYPSGSLGPYAKSYLRNLVTWGLWPVIYALFTDLMTLVQMNSVQNVLNNQSFLGGLVGLGSSMLLGLAGIVMAVAVVLIPVLAYYLIHGDIGQAAARVARTITMGVKSNFKPNDK